MNYYLKRLILGSRQKIVLTGQEFNVLKNARRTLGLLFKLTENYRVVVESYRKIEMAKYEAELAQILYSKLRYEDVSDTKVALNAPISGYLTSTRYFRDSTNKLLPKLLPAQSITAFKEFRQGIDDSIREYRFVEVLRDYAQHCELPIAGITYHNFLENKANLDESDIVTTLSIYASRAALAIDKKFDRSSALDGMPDSIDIIHCIRFHMEGVWKLHEYLTKALEMVATDCRKIISDAITRFEQQTGQDSLGLHAIAESPDAGDCEKIPLLLDWDDARQLAIRKLGNLSNLNRRYITGKVQKKQ